MRKSFFYARRVRKYSKIPVGWGVAELLEHRSSVPRKKRLLGVGDLVGAYINPGTEILYIPFRLLTSKDSDHYYAKFNTSKSYNKLCDILTSMQ